MVASLPELTSTDAVALLIPSIIHICETAMIEDSLRHYRTATSVFGYVAETKAKTFCAANENPGSLFCAAPVKVMPLRCQRCFAFEAD